jgi:hypothetical protein
LKGGELLACKGSKRTLPGQEQLRSSSLFQNKKNLAIGPESNLDRSDGDTDT